MSLAGLGRGLAKGSGTRSSLLWEVERLLIECDKKQLPDVLLMENVPQVIGKKNIKSFQQWELFLESLGYKNYVKCLNAKNFGIPQNRNRCFMVSILGDYYYEFPKKQKLKLKLKDMLETDVDEKYFLSQKMIDRILSWGGYENPLKNAKSDEDIMSTLTTHCGKDSNGMKLNKVKNATKQVSLLGEDGDGVDISTRMETHRGTVQKGMIQTLDTQCNQGVVVGTYQFAKSDKFMYGKNRFQEGKDIADTLQTSQKEGVIIKVGNYNPSGFSSGIVVDPEGLAPTVMENHETVTGVVRHTENYIQFERKGHLDIDNRVYFKDSIAPTTTTTPKSKVLCDLRIRKLTPKECWRLMGFDDEDYDKASKVNTSTQLYKQAGNSIVVNVLMAIFKELL